MHVRNDGDPVMSDASSTAAIQRTPTRLRPLLPLYLVIFIAFIGYAMMVNFFVPLFMNNNGFLPPDASLALRTTTAGVLLAIYPAGQFFGAPVVGAISDRYGRKPVLLASLALALVCYALIALAIAYKQLELLAFACLIGGLSESNIAVAQSAIADVAQPEDRGRLFAYVYSACSCGYIAGPLLGGQIARHFGYEFPFWIVSALLGVTLLWMLASFHETHVAERDKPLDYGATFSNLLTVFTDRPIRRLYFINFLLYLTLFGYFRVIIIYMVARWHMAAQVSTAYYSYMAVMSMTASLLLTGPLLNRFGAKRLAYVSAILAGLGMIVIVLPPDAVSLVFTAGPTSLIGTLTLASCATLLSSAVSGDRQGRVMGNNQALQVGAEAAGAALGGVIAGINIAVPLVAFGLVLVIAGLMLLPMRIAPAMQAA
jgi:DHA1 family tetracycline resistance protein-like MFS transporter